MSVEDSKENHSQYQAGLESEAKKEVEYPRFMSWELVEKWGGGIPSFADSDPQNPEWRRTPHIPIDLSGDGGGLIFVKNEADRASNPTGTIKDRAAWELVTLYRDYARALYLKVKTGIISKEDIEKYVIPRFSIITAGNEGRAVAEAFKPYDLPPTKMLLGKDTSPKILEELLKLRADVYQADLSRELKNSDILRLTNNEGGVDITSAQYIEP